MPEGGVGRIDEPGKLTIPLGDPRYVFGDNPAGSDNEASLVTVDDTALTELSGTDVKAVLKSIDTAVLALEGNASNNDHRFIGYVEPEDFVVPKTLGAKVRRVRGGPDRPEHYYLALSGNYQYAAFEVDMPLGFSSAPMFLDLYYTFDAVGSAVGPYSLQVDIIPVQFGAAFAIKEYGDDFFTSIGYVAQPYGVWKVTRFVDGPIIPIVGVPAPIPKTFTIRSVAPRATVTVPQPQTAGARAVLSIPANIAADNTLTAAAPLFGTGIRFGNAFLSGSTVNTRLKDVTQTTFDANGTALLKPELRILGCAYRRALS